MFKRIQMAKLKKNPMKKIKQTKLINNAMIQIQISSKQQNG